MNDRVVLKDETNMIDGALDSINDFINDFLVINDPSAAYTCTSEFFEYERTRGTGVKLFNIDNAAYSLVKIEKYIDNEFGWLYKNRFFNLKIKTARLFGSQVLSLGQPNLKLVEMSENIFDKTNVSVILLPAIRESNFKYNYEDFNKKNMLYFLLGGWQECITVSIPESLDIYLAKLGKKKRYNLNRQSRKISELIGAELKVFEFYLEEHVPEFIQKMMVLDSNFVSDNSWIRNGYPELAKRGLFHGFVFGSINEQIAVVDAKKTNGTLYVTKIFINSRVKEFSPGSTAIYEIIKFIIANESFTRIDFGYGEPGQKTSSVSGIDYRGRVVIVKKNSLVSYWFLFISKLILARNFIKATMSG